MSGIWVLCQDISNLTFSNSFMFGAASSSYQIEGAWNEDGKGPSIWDHLLHQTQINPDNSNGDVACDSYHRYLEDIAALKELGVNHYRFSISWPRIFPNGFKNETNPAGVQYYNNLINGLLAAGIEPWVTIYHWDTPLPIYYLGHWNSEKIVEYFTDYADFLFRNYGDRVRTWLTINEPSLFCTGINNALGQEDVPPAGVTEYLCGHNILRAHAKVYRLYQLKYKAIQKGRIGIVLSSQFPLPASNSSADIAAAQRLMDFDFGWFLHPLVYGDYPEIMIKTIANYSALQGYPKSRLPKFTLLEKLEIKGAYDIVAINHYSSVLAQPSNNTNITTASYANDVGVTTFQDPSWLGSAASWLKVYPQGFRELLIYVKKNYRNPEIVVTEQGYAGLTNTTLYDIERINYYQLYLSAALEAIHVDRVRLTGYTTWSLLDSFEWNSGYTIGFGLYHVNLEAANRTRFPKASVEFYKNVIATRQLLN